MKTTIGVLGCGWLGLPVAETLVQEGYTVHGTTTSEEKVDLLRKKGIHPHRISLLETQIEGDIQGFLENVSVLILNVPPKLRGKVKENYVLKMEQLLVALRKVHLDKLIFVSSTSVYGDYPDDVSEETPPRPTTLSGEQLLISEQIVKEALPKTTIVRFGGLIGPDRNPVRMLVKKSSLSNGQAPVNLIHLEDCKHILLHIIKKDLWGKLFNGVYPDHPTKKDYYTAQAQQLNLPPPPYDISLQSGGKTIHPKALLALPDFQFRHPI